MTHHRESQNPSSGEEALRHTDTAELEPQSHDDSLRSSTESASHGGAVGGAVIGGVVGGAPGLIGGALLGSVLDDEDSE